MDLKSIMLVNLFFFFFCDSTRRIGSDHTTSQGMFIWIPLSSLLPSLLPRHPPVAPPSSDPALFEGYLPPVRESLPILNVSWECYRERNETWLIHHRKRRPLLLSQQRRCHPASRSRCYLGRPHHRTRRSWRRSRPRCSHLARPHPPTETVISAEHR